MLSAKITRFLAAQYRLGISLKGIIFLHRITSTRFSGSEKRYLETFRRICGEHAFPNVALVTTMWKSVDQSIGLRREVQLQTDFWADLIAKGSLVFQYNGSADMAQAIVGQMMANDDVLLDIQKELSVERRKLDRTAAGSKLASQLEKHLEDRRKEITVLTTSLREADAAHDKVKVKEIHVKLRAEREKQLKQIKARDELRPPIGEETDRRIEDVDKEKKSKGEKWKSRLQTFAAVLTPVIALTVHLILPLAGVSIG